MRLTESRPLERPLAITHVSVVPMDAERVLEDQTVLIEQGRIRAIAPSREVAPPAPGVEHLDGRGKFLMPGLADMHVHIWDVGQANLFLANGVTLVRNMWGAPLHLAMQQKIARRELVGPHVVTTSPIVDGVNADGHTAWLGSERLTDPAEADALVRGYAERGYQQLKVYQLLTFEAHRALCAAARVHGMRVTGHCPDGMTFEQAIANGQTCFEHLVNIAAGHFVDARESPQIRRLGSKASFAQMQEAGQAMVEALDFDSVRQLGALMAERQIWNCPTSAVWIKPAQSLDDAMQDPNLRFMHQETIAGWQQRLGRGDSPERGRRRAALLALQHAGNAVRFRIAKLLLDEGAALLLGTDAPNPFVIPGFAIHVELANLVAAGFSPYRALRCGTSEAARFLDQTDDWGTVGVGKRADLLLLQGNPLQDVAACARPSAVLVNGFLLGRDALDALLDERSASVAVGLAPLELSPVPSGARVVREGVLQNSFGGEPNGFLTYRCSQLGDGAWLLEERRAFGLGQETRRRLWLAADFSVERLEDEYPTPIGELSYIMRWLADRSTYELLQTAVDGKVRRLTVANRRLPPTWGTGLIALPHLITDRTRESTLPALNAAFQARDASDFAAVDMHVAPLPAEAGVRAWQVQINGPAPSDRTYRFDAEGNFLELIETLNGALRTVRPYRPT